MSLKFLWSPSRELFAIIHPEESPFSVLRFNIFTCLTLNFDDHKSIISVLNFPCLVFSSLNTSESLVAL
jgi:hypothetical protein